MFGLYYKLHYICSVINKLKETNYETITIIYYYFCCMCIV